VKIVPSDNQLTEIEYYSIRLLNPFQGILQIVRSDTARALSNDGINWRLQIRLDPDQISRGLVDNKQAFNAYRLFGIWSQRDGLTRLPLQPGLDSEQANLIVSTIISSLENLPDRPFPLKDCFELWLLNKNNELPLALLASACSLDNVPNTVELRWLPCLPGDNNFKLNCYELVSSNTAMEQKGKQASDFLSNLVMMRCKNPPHAYWISRQSDGTGIVFGDETNAPISSTIEFPAELFPYNMITTDIFSPAEQKILNQYLRWVGPYLLSLQNISDTIREQLEIEACRRPTLVHTIHRTIPKIINRKLINAALIEAELLKAAVK